MSVQAYTKRRPPRPRPGIYDLYWNFAAERHTIFEKRVAGAPLPWTPDPILQQYKFCNVYRAADRVSQYLIRNVVYGHDIGGPPDILFRIVAFRMFSKVATWEGVRALMGHAPTLQDLASDKLAATLDKVRQQNGGLYTGAFILCAANPYGQPNKHRNHVELFRHMFLQDNLAERLLVASSFRHIYELLHTYPLMGDFMSYQIAIDLNYSPLLNFTENEFTQPGPGALRGIRKAFEDLGDFSPSDVIVWMVERQAQEFERLGLKFGGLWGRPLHAIDCQGLFCELDKYCRAAAPELRSGRTRIKSRFSPTNEPLILYFPPKWRLNNRLPKKPVLGGGASQKVLI